MQTLDLNGVVIWPGFLTREAQAGMVEDARSIAKAAPLFRPVTSRGQAMSVQMTSAGRCGWVSDKAGYRYEPQHPSGVSWPAIPQSILDVWNAVTGHETLPDCCLVNFYDATARMGLHQDRDEGDFSWPVVSISLGDDALFRVGGTDRGGKTKSTWLRSGDVAVLAGEARLAYHGIDRVKPGTSTVLPQGGRLNLTLRVVR